MSEGSQVSMWEQMQLVFQEKEAIYAQREQKLEAYHLELKKYEDVLNQKILFLEEERTQLDQEKKEIEKRWEELHAYEESAKKSMEAVLEEKLKIQQQENLQMEQRLHAETAELAEMTQRLRVVAEESPSERKEDLKTEDLEAGNADVDQNAEETLKKEENMSPEGRPEDAGADQKVTEEARTDDVDQKDSEHIPDLLTKLEEAAKKVFPNGSVEDLDKEMLCMGVGDKEIRVFLKEPVNEVQIFAIRKGGGTDRVLQQKISRANQLQQDWVFACRENHLTCTMPFTSQTDPDVIMEKCAECITNYFM